MSEIIGEVDVPSGILLILDPGLGRFWRHEAVPSSPRKGDREEFDLAIVGPDAVAAGRAYNRQFDPRYLFDISDLAAAEKHFGQFAEVKKFDAKLQRLERRVPHLERALLAVEVGEGAGVVLYNHLWAVAIGGVPAGRSLQVVANGLPEDSEFTGRWRSIDVVIDEVTPVARSIPLQGVMVEHGQLICADLEAFGSFRMWEPLDGLADFIFWGKDAAAVAKKFNAPQLETGQYGWVDVPDGVISTHAQPVQDWVESEKLHVAVDYRPHCNLEKLNTQIRTTDLEAGQIDLAGTKACGFSNRWGDGIFTVIRDLASDGQLLRIRLDVGNAESQSRLRNVILRHLGAIVTRKVLHGEPIRFAERMEPNNSQDSGWFLSSGTETATYMEDAKNMAIVQLGSMVESDPELAKILESPVGAAFRRTKEGFVPD